MKISFVVIAFQADHMLGACLRSIIPFGDVVCAEGPVKFWQDRGYTTSTDRTNEILDLYDVPTIHGQWAEKTEEVNAAMTLVPPDTNFVWCVDADEIWKAEDIRKVTSLLETDNTDSMSFKATSFFGGFDRYMTGFEEDFEVHRIQRYYPGARFSTHRPPTILAPDGKPWRNHQHMNHEATDKIGIRFFHYSYIFASQMKMKAEYYANMGGNIPDYYNRVYMPWVTGDSDDRHYIETMYNGVHNWLPARRGPCYTAPFAGTHPREVDVMLQILSERFDEELRQV